MSQTINFISPYSLAFPPLTSALTDPNGLLAIGGDLSTPRLINAYKSGIFPWFNEDEPIMWWSPDPRAIISTQDLYINRTLKKILNRRLFSITVNNAFDKVIELCADAPFRQEDTWIVTDMINAYRALHEKGHAHSIEVWQNNELVGGLYGVAVNGYFSGESMFYTKPNASKVALVTLIKRLAQYGVSFIDCQINNPFLSSMGCREISRKEFVELKLDMQQVILPDNFWAAQCISD